MLLQELNIRIGDWDVGSGMELYDHVDMPVSDIFLHERFFAGSLHNDLALIRLIAPLDWNQVRIMYTVAFRTLFEIIN